MAGPIPIGGTNSPAPPPSSAAAPKDIAAKLAEARTNLAASAAASEETSPSLPKGVTQQEAAARRALQQRLVLLLEQQVSNASEMENARSRLAEVTREAQAWTRFDEPPPYSILLTDPLREEMQTEQLKISTGEAAVATAEQFIAENRKALEQAEERIRLINEQIEAAKDASSAARLGWQRDLERLRSQVSAASAGVLDSEQQLRKTALAESRIRLAWLRRKLVIADASPSFTQRDLDKILARIDDDSLQLERELTRSRSRQETAVRQQAEAREEMGKPAAIADAGLKAAETLATREAQLETARAAMRVLRLLLESQSLERVMWESRYAAFGSSSAAILGESERRLQRLIRRQDLWKDYQQQQMAVFPSQIEFQESRINSLPLDSKLLPIAQERLAALREREHLFQRLVWRMDYVQRLCERWAGSLHETERRLPFTGRVQNLFSGAGSTVRKVWNFELFTAEDTVTVDGQEITGRRSVTLGKLFMAVVILVVGIWITGLVSRVAEPVIIRRMKIEANQARLIRRWFRAFMVACLVIFSLVSVKIPLTAFAFAGGALAIALGFGMQTILKNFVSGLILLFERPFRIGDVLEVGGQRGTVTEIGLRASVLQLWDGTETLIPNSSLLENNVSNWTYTHRKVRFSITLGVAYGTDSRRVMQLLVEIAERHGVVEKDPKPAVFFTNFGDSALTFELRYWVDIINANSAQVASDLRQMIAGAFAEHGIVMAFPQRDVHLDTTKPLQVQVVSAEPAQPSKETATDKPKPVDPI
jgi:small-conductance mechanosensitive channel